MVAAQSPVSLGEPEIPTASGRVRGRWRGKGDGVAVFRGIPFASPPVGPLRFLAPQPPQAWGGVLDAAASGPIAPQALPLPGDGDIASPGPGPDEGNWLTLNVWSPDLGAADSGGGLPVLVWIHGGAYIFGSGSDPRYDGTTLAGLGAVVVTCNYRLGVEGFAQLEGAPANRGLLDAVAALGWVAQNVARFGGDPSNVTIFGESAGAGVIAALLAMPRARGLFRRAIAQSVPGTFFTPGLAGDITRAIAAEAGITGAGAGPVTRAALAGAAPARLVQAQMAVTQGMRRHRQWGPVALTITPFSPVVDGEVLPRAPWRALLSGAARDVDLLVGHNRDEYKLFIEMAGQGGRVTREQAAEALAAFAPDPEAYRRAYPSFDAERLYERVFSDWLFRMPSLHLAQAHAASGGRTYLYELTYRAPASPAALGACHGLDLPLVWGGREGDGPGEAGPQVTERLNLLTGTSPPQEFSDLGALMRAEWLAFARTGAPGWPVYGTERRLARVYDRPADVDPYPEEASMRLWDRHQFDTLGLAPSP
ncbi:MAG TPA: carboxylesterase family protein [Trebonia sp.]|nr:carboxylesterase family protein [Trebonia sp.]